mgnify:CR=1 FL=1|tara:strand:+ start:385 stop:606 length:222 start_codon:yes stop_codon:yes gene_type:complete
MIKVHNDTGETEALMSIRRIAFVVVTMLAWLVYLSQAQDVDLLEFSKADDYWLPTFLVFIGLAVTAIFFVRKD